MVGVGEGDLSGLTGVALIAYMGRIFTPVCGSSS